MRFSSEEIASKILTPESVNSAVNQIMINGHVVLEDVLPLDLVNQMKTVYLEHLDKYVAEVKVENSHVNEATKRGANRFRMYMPFSAPFIDPQVLGNDFVLQIIDELFGADNYNCVYYASDTPLPGSDDQGMHSDIPPLFPGSSAIIPPFLLAINIPLVDVTEENGPTEILPGGTHMIPENLNTPFGVQEIASHMKPIRLTMSAGSILIRDLRMWHRGTANHSDEVRPMLALLYARPWYWWGGKQGRMGIPQEVYADFPERIKRLFDLEMALEYGFDYKKAGAYR